MINSVFTAFDFDSNNLLSELKYIIDFFVALAPIKQLYLCSAYAIKQVRPNCRFNQPTPKGTIGFCLLKAHSRLSAL